MMAPVTCLTDARASAPALPQLGVRPGVSRSGADVALTKTLSVAAAPEAETPIFCDHTGRRGRLVRAAGALSMALGAAWVGVLLAGSLGGGALPALDGGAGALARTGARPAAITASPSTRPREVAQVGPRLDRTLRGWPALEAVTASLSAPRPDTD